MMQNPVSTVTLEFTAEHTGWEGDGQDEQIMVDQLLGLLGKLPFGAVRVVEVDTYPSQPAAE